jgi:hypothetical protein
MLEAMGPDGVSSDEDVVVDNKKVYHVKILPHRSTRVLSRIKYIDGHANHTNGYGNSPPGTPPRIRIRPEKPEESRRKPPIGWPQNLYRSQWIAGLSDVHYGYLGAKNDFDLRKFDIGQRFAGVSNFSQ